MSPSVYTTPFLVSRGETIDLHPAVTATALDLTAELSTDMLKTHSVTIPTRAVVITVASEWAKVCRIGTVGAQPVVEECRLVLSRTGMSLVTHSIPMPASIGKTIDLLAAATPRRIDSGTIPARKVTMSHPVVAE